MASLKQTVAKRMGISKKEATRVTDLVINSLIAELRNRSGSPVTVPGLGSFKVVKKKARHYRHPGDGTIQIASPKTTIKFSPSSTIFSRA
jgi:nucleoid DNA-binding protein